MFRKLFVLGVVAVTAALLVACGGDDDDAGGASSPDGASGVTRVVMVDSAFEPESFTATAGRELTLELRNSGDLPHSFTIDGLVDSGVMNGGAAKSVTFTPGSAGRLTYFCTVHGQAAMSGTLTVN